MMNLFIANIGGRDLWVPVNGGRYAGLDGLDGGKILQKWEGKVGVRAVGELMRHAWQKEDLDFLKWLGDGSGLRLPILDASFQYLQAEGVQPDRVILMCTDQPSADAHSGRDTYHVAHSLAEYLLPTRWGMVASSFKVLPNRGNPSSYEEAQLFLGRDLEKSTRALGPIENLAVSMRGGTPAMNAALMSWSLDRFGKRVILLEVDEPSVQLQKAGKSGAVYDVDTWPLRKAQVLRVVTSLLDQHRYSGALSFLDAELSKEEGRMATIQDAFKILAHGAARLNLDFHGAMGALQGLTHPKARDWRKSAGAGVLNFARLGELREMALLRLRIGDSFGFVLRVAMMAEASRRLVAQQLTGVNLSSRRPMIPFADFSPDCLNYLRGLPRGQRPSEVGGDRFLADKKLFQSMIRFGTLSPVTALPGHCTRLLDLLQKLDRLEQLRVQAYHYIRGPDRRTLNAAMGNLNGGFEGFSKQHLGAVEQVLTALGHPPPPGPDIYSELKEAILEKIREAEMPQVP